MVITFLHTGLGLDALIDNQEGGRPRSAGLSCHKTPPVVILS